MWVIIWTVVFIAPNGYHAAAESTQSEPSFKSEFECRRFVVEYNDAMKVRFRHDYELPANTPVVARGQCARSV